MKKRLSLLRAVAEAFVVGCLLRNGVIAGNNNPSHSVAFLPAAPSNGDFRALAKSGLEFTKGRPLLDHFCTSSTFGIHPPKQRSSLGGHLLPSDDDDDKGLADGGIRLNKVFKATHSRREADALIDSGRVSVNGQAVFQKGGFLVQPFVDQVALDGVLIEGWEAMNGFRNTPAHNQQRSKSEDDPIDATHQQEFEYIKYYKPRGVTCTTDPSVDSNIIDDLTRRRGYQPKHRVYPVGRLDKDSSGLILLTSDGRLPNSVLRGMFKQPKVYHVWVDRPLRHVDLERLRNGVVITTVAQRDGTNRGKALTAPTLPCPVECLPGSRQLGVSMTLVEGRNRQIRRMMQALGYEVVDLHRVQFMNITLEGLQRAGEWKALDEGEMALVHHVLHQAATAAEVIPEPQQ